MKPVYRVPFERNSVRVVLHCAFSTPALYRNITVLSSRVLGFTTSTAVVKAVYFSYSLFQRVLGLDATVIQHVYIPIDEAGFKAGHCAIVDVPGQWRDYHHVHGR